jgi:hypothetical protein
MRPWASCPRRAHARVQWRPGLTLSSASSGRPLTFFVIRGGLDGRSPCFQEALEALERLVFQTYRSRLYRAAALVALGRPGEAHKLTEEAVAGNPGVTVRRFVENERYRDQAMRRVLRARGVSRRPPPRRAATPMPAEERNRDEGGVDVAKRPAAVRRQVENASSCDVRGRMKLGISVARRIEGSPSAAYHFQDPGSP